MSDFLIYAARLQDAGVTSLRVSLGSNKDGTRLMHVSPDSTVPRELAAKYPTRTFELCGTDRVLEKLKDDMAYSEDGPTPEKVQAAINAHPLLADDLREWFADWLLVKAPTDEELAAAEADVDEAEVERSVQRMKDMLRGLDIARRRDAQKTAPKYGPDNPPRLRKPGESVEEYRAAMGWSTKPHNGQAKGRA